LFAYGIFELLIDTYLVDYDPPLLSLLLAYYYYYYYYSSCPFACHAATPSRYLVATQQREGGGVRGTRPLSL